MPFPFPTLKNDDPFMHRTQHGAIFVCERADLRSPVVVLTDRDNILKEAVEFGAWHAQTVWPELNGFSGYDTIQYKVVPCWNPTEVYEAAGGDLKDRAHALCSKE